MATQDIINYRDFTDNQVRILTGSGEDYNRTRYSAQAKASGASPDAVKAAGDRGAERYRRVQERETSGRRVDSNGTAIMDEIRRVGTDNTYVDRSRYADGGQSYMGREGNDKIQIVMTDSTAAEEVNHARNFVWRFPKRLGTPDGSDPSAYYTHQAGEIQSAMSGALPWIDSTSGNPMWNDGDAKRFGADLSDRFRKSGMSASDFVNSLDIPDNTKGMFQGYLEDRPGARKYLENDENWRNISSVGFNGSSVGNMAAAKGGKKTTGGQLANFLATDKVPPTIFGIPVVTRREDYTEADLRFFSEHPEAGGYYSMGNEETPEDGSEEGAPVQADMPVRGPYPGAWNNPGNVRPGEVVYDGETGIVLGAVSKTPFLTFKTPQNGLDAMGQSIGQMVRVKIPEKYGKDGKFTLGNLISIYAPANDKNDPDEYAKFVSDLTGIGLDDELRLDDAKTMSKMLKAMVRKDSGEPHSSWFGDGNYLKAAKKMLVPATKMRNEKGGK